MLAVRALARVRGGLFYGWYMVAAGFALMFFFAGIGVYGFAAFLGPILKEFRWPQALVGAAFSFRSLEGALLGPVMGFLVDRVGPRPILIAGFLIEGLGLILLSQVHSLWQFYLAFAVLALGMSGGAFLVISTAINNWFERLRGRAFSIMMLGPAFSGLMVSALIWIVATIGWRNALLGTAATLWVFCIPLSLVMRRRPEAYGLLPDGGPAREAERGSGGVGRAAAPARVGQLRVGSILRSRSYWQFVLAVALQGAGFGALALFQIVALESFGLTVAQTAVVVTVWTLSSIPGRLVGGFLADFVDKRLVFAGSILFQLVGAVFFLTLQNLWMGLAYAVIFGMGWGASVPVRPALQGEYWGRNLFGLLMGLQGTFGAAVGITAPILVGRWYDVYQDYHGAFLILFLPLIVSFVLILTLKKPTSEEATPLP